MTLNGTDLLIAVVLLALGCVLTYVSLQRAFKRAFAELRLETERQLNAFTSTLKALQTQVAQLSQSPAIKPSTTTVSVPLAKVEATAPTAKAAVHQDEITPEMLVVMAAAVTAFLGKKVRIRSAKMLQSPYEIVNPWSQQGRVFVQASHNLRSRG